jgi:hypothetical protein
VTSLNEHQPLDCGGLQSEGQTLSGWLQLSAFSHKRFGSLCSVLINGSRGISDNAVQYCSLGLYRRQKSTDFSLRTACQYKCDAYGPVRLSNTIGTSHEFPIFGVCGWGQRECTCGTDQNEVVWGYREYSSPHTLVGCRIACHYNCSGSDNPPATHRGRVLHFKNFFYL